MVESHKLIGSFDALADDGTRYTINIFRLAVEVTRTGTGEQAIVGLPYMKTTDGLPVARKGEGRYRIIGPNIEVTSVDPIPW